MKTFEKISIEDWGFPIYHSEYLSWIIGLSKLSKKDKERIIELYRRILSLIASPDDIIIDNIRIFLDNQLFTFENIKDLDFAATFNQLSKYPLIHVEKKSPVFSPGESKKSTEESNKKPVLDYLKMLAAKQDSKFFYHTVFITKEELLKKIETEGMPHYIISEELLPYLRFLDLSNISFSNVDLRGVDLSYTNIRSIDFTSLYQNSLENTNLEGVALVGQELRNINADGANLQGTYLVIDLNTTSIDQTSLDGTNILLKHDRIITNTRKRKKINALLHF